MAKRLRGGRGDIALVVSSAAAMQIGPLFANQSANSLGARELSPLSRTWSILHKSCFLVDCPDKPSQVHNIKSGPVLKIMGP